MCLRDSATHSAATDWPRMARRGLRCHVYVRGPFRQVWCALVSLAKVYPVVGSVRCEEPDGTGNLPVYRKELYHRGRGNRNSPETPCRCGNTLSRVPLPRYPPAVALRRPVEWPTARFAATYTDAEGSTHAKIVPARVGLNSFCDVLCDITIPISSCPQQSAEMAYRRGDRNFRQHPCGSSGRQQFAAVMAF